MARGGIEISSSSRRESQPIHLLTHGQPVSGEIPSTTPDTRSVRSTSGPLGPEKHSNHSLPYIDPCQPVPVRIVDPSKDLNSYGLSSVGWKERVKGWKLKQEKNVVPMANCYTQGKGGDIEGTGSIGDELMIYFEATNYLNANSLLDLTCQTVADMIKGKTPERDKEDL